MGLKMDIAELQASLGEVSRLLGARVMPMSETFRHNHVEWGILIPYFQTIVFVAFKLSHFA